MTPDEIARHAKAVFDAYAGMSPPEEPLNQMSALQLRVARWHNVNFGATPDIFTAAGVAEETGELLEGLAPVVMALLDNVFKLVAAVGRLNHAALKNAQGIRGLGDPEVYRAAVADALADIAIFSMNMSTGCRMDYGALIWLVADKVIKRQWKQSPTTGG